MNFKMLSFITASMLAVLTHPLQAADGKLLATPGVSQIEGVGGGGFVPWAQLAGYASRDEVSANVFYSRASVDDYHLNVRGLQVNLFDRVELSIAEQQLHVDAFDLNIEQTIFGAKARLYGDLVYSKWPMVSAGIQHKRNHDPEIGRLLGAQKDIGNDFYLATSKLHLGAAFGYNFLWNVTARNTEANQLGLLGFGGSGQNREWVIEASTAVLVNRHIAVGVEFRQKPDSLATKEDHWRNVFVAYVPNQWVSITAAYLDLGEIAGAKRQKGPYLSVTGYF